MADTDAYWQAPARSPAGAGQRVTVLGAGIVGLSSAAALARAGFNVTVMDAEPEVGQVSSFGNGCQLSYGYVAPLAQPGLLAELPRLLLAKDAPLKIVPRADPRQWAWMLQFLWACNRRQASQGSLDLLALGHLSQRETDLWMAGASGEALGFSRSGKIVLLADAPSWAKARAQVALQAPHGPAQQLLSQDQCLALEPALERFRGAVAGAVYTPSECAVDSLALCRNLQQRLRQRGVKFEMGTRALGFRQARGRVTHIDTDSGPREVEQLVIATGVASAVQARQLGFSIAVYPLKGYSITVPIVDSARVPRPGVTDLSKKVVYARIGNRLRVAGVAEIRGHDLRLDPARINELLRHTQKAFGDAIDGQAVQAWTGLRPATPTSIPIIARSPLPNVYLNAGHGALGLTLAFGSASRLADLMASA